MKKINIVLASSTAAVLLAASPLLASAHHDSNSSNGGDDTRVEASTNAGLHLGQLLHVELGGDSKIKGDDNDHRATSTHATSTPASKNGMTVVAGTVTNVNGSTITVSAKGGTTYTVNAANATVSNKDSVAIDLSQVRVGDVVVARGTLTGTTLVATRLMDGAVMARAFLSALGIAGAGTVTSVNGSTFTVKPLGTHATTTVSTDAATVYKLNGGAASSSALSVGSQVFVTGTSTNSGATIAASIVNIFTAGFGFFRHLFR